MPTLIRHKPSNPPPHLAPAECENRVAIHKRWLQIGGRAKFGMSLTRNVLTAEDNEASDLASTSLPLPPCQTFANAFNNASEMARLN